MTTVQDVFLTFYPKYKEKYRSSMEQTKAAKDIMSCRTSDSRISMIKRAYSGSARLIDEAEIYSSEKLYSWINIQKKQT